MYNRDYVHEMDILLNRVRLEAFQNLLYLELFTNRFAKLQDYMGSTLFDLCLQH